MTKPALRIAVADYPQSLEMSEAIMALAREIIAQAPTGVMVIWEIPGRENEVNIFCRSLPDSVAMRHGMVGILFDQYNPVMHNE